MQLKTTACCSPECTNNTGWKMCHMWGEYVFMRWFFMQRGHTLLYIHIETDRIDLLWEMELSTHYQELSLKILFWLISFANRILTWFLSFQQEMQIYRDTAENICKLLGTNNDEMTQNMIIPCYFLKSVPQIPKLTVLWIYSSQKCSRVFRPLAQLHRKYGREGFQRCAQVGQPKFIPWDLPDIY